MAGIPRPGPPKKTTSTSMRPPSTRPAQSRAASAAPYPSNGRASPAESVVSVATTHSKMRSPTPSRAPSRAGTKRKLDYDDQETNINVVVRCRGRNDREVRENSGVVVSTNGIKGNTVELSMGPSALSNKTYNFDKVFSPAADQGMIFDEVVAPILDEVLNGFNCTIFAYGQTGTGKTYTMSGDITDILPLPDAAGIIPRVLHSLFAKLEGDEAENSVKCSFIELYNEELRDLLSPDDSVKLKIYDDNSKKGHSSTVVQGMEESHIKSASKGIQLLREGSHKRQVAATKCNDLSSRSHTVFTITVYMKRTSDTGEDFVSAGKLNLVDLAGSENIQRSGAENKRATEAGLINKSLLTLGRVINALVDKSSHIPYRESKLTRLLQDSLGGRTKTCIIATLSPAKSNLEETISTLDYAFRAKNIRNKPQVNQMVSKKTLLREFTAEIEKLKSELIATRQRNGVYLTQETWEEITTESESRRILSEEQRDKIETMEVNLRNKVQELFSLTTNFNSLKKDNEATKLMLDGTKSLLEKTEVVLSHTRQNLEEEAMLRKAHQATEEKLAYLGQDMISTLGKTTSDISGLHSKLRRRSDLQSLNRQNWHSSQTQVSDITRMVEERIGGLAGTQEKLMNVLSSKMKTFIEDELQQLGASRSFLQEKADSFEVSRKEVNEQNAKSRDDLNDVLEEIKTLREDVKQKLGAGLDDLSAAAQKISAGIITELEEFDEQLNKAFVGLGREFKGVFEELVHRIHEQQVESDRLRQQLAEADEALLAANRATQTKLKEVINEEKRKAAEERRDLLTKMTALITDSAEQQEARMDAQLTGVSREIESTNATYSSRREAYNEGMDVWSSRSKELINKVVDSRESIKAKIKTDYANAHEQATSLRQTTTSVHDSTMAIVEAQKSHMDTQLQSLDDIVVRVREQNNVHHTAHTNSLAQLGQTVQSSYTSIAEHFQTSFSRVQGLGTDVESQADALRATLPQLAPGAELRGPLADLRARIEASALAEYTPTGQTPQRVQYPIPSTLPRTEPHEKLLARLRGGRGPSPTPDVKHEQPDSKMEDGEEGDETVEQVGEPREREAPAPAPAATRNRSPSKGMVFADVPDPSSLSSHSQANTHSSSTSTSSTPGLRELDVNALGPYPPVTDSSTSTVEAMQPPLKRQNTGSGGGTGGATAAVGSESKLPMKKKARMTVAALSPADRENVGVMADFSKSVGGAAAGLGVVSAPGAAETRKSRRLRSQGHVLE